MALSTTFTQYAPKITMSYEPILVEILLFERGWVTLNENFWGKGASPTNDFWHQKISVPGLSYG